MWVKHKFMDTKNHDTKKKITGQIKNSKRDSQNTSRLMKIQTF